MARSGSTDGSGLRRSSRETSSTKEAAESPANTRKSGRIEKLTSPVKSKPEKNEKETGPSPLRRSDRGKNISPVSSDVVSKKRKRINAQSYKSIFKPQQRKLVTDVDKEVDKNGHSLEDKDDDADKCSDEAIGKGSPITDKKASGTYLDLEIEESDCKKKINLREDALNSESVEETPDITQQAPLDVRLNDSEQTKPSDNENGNKKSSAIDDHTSTPSECKKPDDVETCIQNSKKPMVNHGLEEPESCGLVNNSKDDCKFVEFWVPVQLSNLQLEQYCATLIENAMVLRSVPKSTTIGALHDIIISHRKCCNHPYIVEPSLQQVVMKDRETTMLLDVGIEASGKLQFLDLILPEVKKRQLRVIILYQSTVANGKSNPVGDILDDLIHQRFGEDSYERVDGHGVVPAMKQAALNNFNNNKSKFVFLLDHRACLSTSKLSSVDIIILLDSDLNPSNDLRTLQKVSFSSHPEQILIFRLYSRCTLEEKIFKLVEQNVAIDSKVKNLNRVSCDALLMWGASNLFDKLTKFHSSSAVEISSEDSSLKDVFKEFVNIISNKSHGKALKESVITKAHTCGTYDKSLRLKGLVSNGESPQIFWKNLLEGKYPRWKFASVSTPRQRKRTSYFGNNSNEIFPVNADVVKKRRKTSKKPLLEVETEEANEGGAEVAGYNESQSSSGDYFWSTEVVHEKSLRDILKPTVFELCKILNFSDDVKLMVEKFLEYVLDHYSVTQDHTSTLQAFMMSLCWIGGLLSKHEIDKSESFALAKKHLHFICLEKEVESVFLKLESAKEAFLENQAKCDSLKDSSVPETAQATFTESTEPRVEVKLEVSENHESSNEEALQKKEMEQGSKKEVKEIEIFNGEWDEIRARLEKDYSLEKALIRSVHRNPSVRSEKLKSLDREFAKKFEEHERIREIHFKDLMEKLLPAEADNGSHTVQEVVPNSSSRNLIGEEISTPYEPDPIEVIYPNGGGGGGGSDEVIGEHTCANHVEPGVVLLVDEAGTVMLPSNRVGESNNPILFTGSHASEKKIDDATHGETLDVGSTEMGTPAGDCNEEEAKRGDSVPYESDAVNGDCNEVGPTGTPAGDSNEETAEGGPVASNDVEGDHGETSPCDDVAPGVDGAEMGTPAGNCDEERKCNETGPGVVVETGTTPAGGCNEENAVASDAVEGDCNEKAPGDVAPCVDRAELGTPAGNCDQDNGEDTTMILDTALVEDQNNLFDSSNNTPSAVLLQDTTPAAEVVASPAPDHPMSTLPEIQNESLQPQCGIQDNQQLVDGGQVGQIASEVPSLKPKEEPLCTENQSDILPSGGLLLHEEQEPEQAQHCAPQGSSRLAQINGSDQTMLQSEGNEEEHPSPSPTVEPQNTDQQPEAPDQNGSQPEINIFNHEASWMPNNQADPLQAEVERLCALKDNAVQYHEDIKQRLKSDCEKEIAEMIAQIKAKYEAKRLEAETSFLSRKKELDNNLDKVIMNQSLAEAFRSKCQDFTPSSHPRVTQAGLMQQRLHRYTTPSLIRLSNGPTSSPSSGPSANSQPITSLATPPPPPPLQIVHQPAALFSTTPNTTSRPPPITTNGPGPTVNPSTTPSRVEPVTPLTTLNRPSPPGFNPVTPSTTPTRPPLCINTITPSTGNQRINTETRGPAPHLRPLVSNEIRSPAPHLRPLVSNEVRSPAPHLRPLVNGEIRGPAPHIRPFRPSTVPPEDSTVLPAPPPSSASSWLPSRSPSSQPQSLYRHHSGTTTSLSHSSSLPRVSTIPTTQTGRFSPSQRSGSFLAPDNLNSVNRNHVGPSPLSNVQVDIDLTELNEFIQDFRHSPNGHDLVCLSDDD